MNAVTLGRTQILWHHSSRESAKPITRDVGAGQSQQYSWGRLRLRCIDILDARMRVRGKHVHPVAHTGQGDIVDVATLPPKEALIFHTPDCLPDSEFNHLPSPARFVAMLMELRDARALN